MQSGRFKHPVTVQRATEVRDGHGQPVRTWATFAPWRCAIDPFRGAERFAAQQLTAEVTHKLTGHYFGGVSAKDRVVTDVGSRVFRIEAVINVGEQSRQLELLCVEVIA